MSSAISALGLSTFHSFGYQIFDQFFDQAAVNQLIESIEALPPDQLADRKRRGVLFARRNLVEIDFVQSLLARADVIDLVRTIAADAIPVRAILFDKTGNANWTVPWHQDRSIMVAKRVDLPGFGPWSAKAGVVHVQPPVEILQQMFTLRLHLDACGADNGPLRVIPDTHLRILGAAEVEAIVAARAPTDCITTVGGLLIMRPLILHSSLPAKQPRHRRVIHIEFGPRDLPAPLRWANAAES